MAFCRRLVFATVCTSLGCTQLLGLSEPGLGETDASGINPPDAAPVDPPADATPAPDTGPQGLCAPLPTFGAATNYGVGQMPTALAVGDLDHILTRDVVVVSRMTSSFTLYHGQAGGGLAFQEVIPFGLPPECAPMTGAESVGVGDFNGDGFQDIMYAAGPCPGPTHLVVRRQDNAMPGIFLPEVLVPGPQGSRVRFAVGDLNNDARDDVALVSQAGLQVLFGRNDAPGTFLAGFADANAIDEERPVIADLNGDGDVDLAWLGEFGVRYSLQSSTAGQFGAAVTLSSGANDAFAVGDLNGDALNDLLVVEGVTAQIFLQNSSNHALMAGVTFSKAGRNDLAIIDVNKDGRNDIAWDGHVDLQCAAPFAPGTFDTSMEAEHVTIIDMAEAVFYEDLNGDGKRDALGLRSTTGQLVVAIQQ